MMYSVNAAPSPVRPSSSICFPISKKSTSPSLENSCERISAIFSDSFASINLSIAGLCSFKILFLYSSCCLSISVLKSSNVSGSKMACLSKSERSVDSCRLTSSLTRFSHSISPLYLQSLFNSSTFSKLNLLQSSKNVSPLSTSLVR